MTRQALAVTGVLLALFALLFGYASVEPAPAGAPNPLGERRLIASEQEKLRAELNDPESARFRASFVSKRGGEPVVCGEVNYRNTAGGYVGFQRFIAGSLVRKVRDQGAPGEIDALWSEHCGDRARPRGARP